MEVVAPGWPARPERLTAGGRCRASAGLFDRDPAGCRPGLRIRGADLEDSLLISGSDVLGIRLFGKPNSPGKRAATAIYAMRLLILLLIHALSTYIPRPFVVPY